MKITLREMIFFALLFCLPLATYMLVFKPRQVAEQILREDISAKRKLSADFDKYRVQAIGNIEEDLAALMAIKAKSVSRLPESPDMGPVIDELSRIAKSNNLKISRMQSVSLSDKEKLELSTANYGIQRLDIELDGNYIGFYRFLAEMEKMPRIIHVQNLDIQRVEEGNRQGDIKVRTDLRVYYGKPQKENGGAK